MNKVFSIVSVLIIILAGLQVTISSHYCGGRQVASRVSLAGIPASCGMEETGENCPLPGHQLSTDCCEDHVKIAAIDNIFTITYFSREVRDKINPPFIVTNSPQVSTVSYQLPHTCFNPPGSRPASSVNLEEICVFRI